MKLKQVTILNNLEIINKIKREDLDEKNYFKAIIEAGDKITDVKQKSWIVSENEQQRLFQKQRAEKRSLFFLQKSC